MIQKTEGQLKFVSSLFIGSSVHDAVREGHQTMSYMEDYNNASAMAAPGTHQLSAGLEIIALHNKTVQALICTGTIQHVFVWLKISNEKHTKMTFTNVKECALVFYQKYEVVHS